MNEQLTAREKWCYGLGDVGSNMSWNMVASFLLLFYTNTAMLPVAMIGTLLLVSRVMDALIDPAIGIIVDRTRSRFGKARPYLLFAPFPLAIFLVLLFYSPPASTPVKVAYAYATLIVIGIVYSFVNIPYGALMALMTRDPDQKMQLSGLRTGGSAVGTTIVTALTIPLVNFIGPERPGFTIAAAIFAVISTGLFLVVFKNTKERFEDRSSREKLHLRRDLAVLLTNRPWLVTFSFSFLNLMRLGVLVGAIAYFALDVLQKPWMISVLLPLLSASSMLAASVSPALFKRFGIRGGNLIALAVSFVGFVLLPLTERHPVLFLIVFLLANTAMGACTVAVWAMSANAIDYQQWRHGTRNDGLLISSISLSTKVGIAAGLSLTAYALAWAHFNPLILTESARNTIRVMFYGGSLLFVALQLVCISFYNLDRLHPEIVRELNARSLMNLDAVSLNQQVL